MDRSYIYAGAQPIAFYDGDWRSDGTRYYYMHDRLGSVRAVANTAGAIVNNYTYNPYGEDITGECTETVENPLKYTAQFHDKKIGQYHLRARQYDPHINRFTTRDPVKGKAKLPLTTNPYLYCGSNPINLLDPDGKFAIGIGLSGSGLLRRKIKGSDTFIYEIVVFMP